MSGAAVPPPPGGDATGADGGDVAGLARELDLLRRRVDALASSVDGVPGRVEELAGVVVRLSDTLATFTARKSAPVAPSWLLAPADDGAVAGLLDELGRWLGLVFVRYPDGASALPECWMWHPAVVEELLWLMHAWCAAYQGANASVAGAGDWHDRQRPGVVARLRKMVGSCSIEAHQTRPGWQAESTGPTQAPGLTHTALIVSWWARHRDETAPEPAPGPSRPIGGALG